MVESTSIVPVPVVVNESLSVERMNNNEMMKSHGKENCNDHHMKEQQQQHQDLYLEFHDNVDLQTRIVLLPLNDGDCTGAVVASYTTNDTTTTTTSSSSVKISQNKNDSPNPVESERRDSAVNSLSSNDPLKECNKQTSSSSPNNTDNQTQLDDTTDSQSSQYDTKLTKPQLQLQLQLQEADVIGCILVGIKGVDIPHEGKEIQDWKSTDFTEILSILRDAPAPIVLHLQKNNQKGNDTTSDTTTTSQPITDDANSTITSECSSCLESDLHSTKIDTTNTNTNTTKTNTILQVNSPERKSKKPTNEIRGKLSAWGSRVAAEAQRRAEKALLEIKHSHDGTQNVGPPNVPTQIAVQNNNEQTVCSIFLHNVRDGKYIPLLPNESKDHTLNHCEKDKFPINIYGKQSQHPSPNSIRITNSSVLSIRQTGSAKPCPKGYSFQWLRSNTNGDGWQLLEGANFATFQPSANDIGHKIKCIVTIKPDEGDQVEESITCHQPYCIESDLPLLNGARSSFLPGGGVISSVGACFSGFVGFGSKAQGKKFKIHLEMSNNGCLMSIVLVSGTKVMLCHDRSEPMMKVTAMANPSSPRELDIIFTQQLSSSAMLLSSFCEEGNRLRLLARNRTMRESFLLALGIANFTGSPADLKTHTMLFHNSTTSETGADAHEIVEDQIILPDEKESEAEKDDVDSTSLDTDELPSKQILDESTETLSVKCGDEKKMQSLERAIQKDLNLLREKLGAKDKILIDLRQRLRLAETELDQARKYGFEAEQKRDTIKAQYGECYTNFRLSQKRIMTQADEIKRLKNDLDEHVSKVKEERIIHNEKEQAYIKSMKVMENEKAVLSAAVEARTSKLKKMDEVKEDLLIAQKKLSNGKVVQKKLDEMVVDFQQIKLELIQKEASEKETKAELVDANAEVESLKKQLAAEKKKSKKYQLDFEQSRMKCNKFKGERNTLKQKSATLAKEISRICRDGRTISDIVEIMDSEKARKMEVEILKQQKRKAQETLEVYRNSFEMSLRAHENANVTKDAILALEQKAELERVVSHLTQYVNAKEMQLETMKAVNQTLTEELQSLTLTKGQKSV